MQTYNLRTWETEAGGYQFQANLSYRKQKAKPNKPELYKARWHDCLCVSENEAGGYMAAEELELELKFWSLGVSTQALFTFRAYVTLPGVRRHRWGN